MKARNFKKEETLKKKLIAKKAELMMLLRQSPITIWEIQLNEQELRFKKLKDEESYYQSIKKSIKQENMVKGLNDKSDLFKSLMNNRNSLFEKAKSEKVRLDEITRKNMLKISEIQILKNVIKELKESEENCSSLSKPDSYRELRGLLQNFKVELKENDRRLTRDFDQLEKLFRNVKRTERMYSIHYPNGSSGQESSSISYSEDRLKKERLRSNMLVLNSKSSTEYKKSDIHALLGKFKSVRESRLSTLNQNTPVPTPGSFISPLKPKASRKKQTVSFSTSIRSNIPIRTNSPVYMKKHKNKSRVILKSIVSSSGINSSQVLIPVRVKPPVTDKHTSEEIDTHVQTTSKHSIHAPSILVKPISTINEQEELESQNIDKTIGKSMGRISSQSSWKNNRNSKYKVSIIEHLVPKIENTKPREVKSRQLSRTQLPYIPSIERDLEGCVSPPLLIENGDIALEDMLPSRKASAYYSPQQKKPRISRKPKDKRSRSKFTLFMIDSELPDKKNLEDPQSLHHKSSKTSSCRGLNLRDCISNGLSPQLSSSINKKSIRSVRVSQFKDKQETEKARRLSTKLFWKDSKIPTRIEGLSLLNEEIRSVVFDFEEEGNQDVYYPGELLQENDEMKLHYHLRNFLEREEYVDSQYNPEDLNESSFTHMSINTYSDRNFIQEDGQRLEKTNFFVGTEDNISVSN